MKRSAKIGLKVAGAIVAAIALLTGSTMLVLRTSWGGERLRRAIVSRVNDQIQGHFDIARLTFGGDHLALRGVALRDPDGRLVADVAGVDVTFSIVRLLHREMRVSALSIDTPQLGLLGDARGMNLARAMAPRRERPKHEPAPRAKTDREGWVVNLQRIEIKGGDVAMAVTPPGTAGAQPRLHLAALNFLGKVRYALGNGSLDLAARLDGESRVAPVGPLQLAAQAQIRGEDLSSQIDGVLLGGTIHARTALRGTRFENADATVAIAIPAFSLAGNTWGPLRIDGTTRAGGVPVLDLAVALPGIAVSGKGGGSDGFSFDGKLALNDLAQAARAVGDLTGRALPAVAGHGRIDVWCGGKMNDAPVSWSGRAKGAIEHLRVGENAIDGLTLEGRTAHVAKSPDLADVEIHVASIHAGTVQLGAIALGAAIRGQAISAKATLASPEAVDLTLSGTLDTEPHSLALEFFTVRFPDVLWSADGIAHVSFGESLSLTNFRLRSQGQTIAIDASKTGDAIDAHLAVQRLRLALLPHVLIDPSLHLGGLVDADVRAGGTVAQPRVVARIELDGGRARTWSRVDANLRATLADGRVDGSADVDAPFGALAAAFRLPVAMATAGAPIDARIDVTRLDLGELLRGLTATTPPVDGRVTLNLKIRGTTDQPTVNLEAQGSRLKASLPPGRAQTRTADSSTDLGQASLRLTYADRVARANLSFASAHGGSLRVDASANADLGYPRVVHGPALSKLPVRGQVTARDLAVAWLAQFNPRVESLGGRVTADAKLAGTLADPRFIGDVRWKDGGGVLSRVTADSGTQGRRSRPSSVTVGSRGRGVE
jgi:autotransporter translocation and assembly factor TamB